METNFESGAAMFVLGLKSYFSYICTECES